MHADKWGFPSGRPYAGFAEIDRRQFTFSAPFAIAMPTIDWLVLYAHFAVNGLRTLAAYRSRRRRIPAKTWLALIWSIGLPYRSERFIVAFRATKFFRNNPHQTYTVLVLVHHLENNGGTNLW
jgi:hypothetical protein